MLRGNVWEPALDLMCVKRHVVRHAGVTRHRCTARKHRRTVPTSAAEISPDLLLGDLVMAYDISEDGEDDGDQLS